MSTTDRDRDLQQFLARLDRDGELTRVREPVSPILEVSAAAQRERVAPCARKSATAAAFDPGHAEFGGHALLFEKVAGCDFPLAINVYGSYRRTELALGCAESGGLEAIAARIGALAKPQPPTSLAELFGKAREFLPLLRVPPKTVRRGACQEIVKLAARGEVDLRRLPLIRCWPHDGDPRAVGYPLSPEQAGTAGGEGRYVTFAGMHTIHADDEGLAKPASHNIGMYRAQLVDATRLVMHWHVHHDGAAHWRSWKRKGKPMPIAICLGGEPVLPYAATAPLPPGLSELLLAGFLNGGGIPLVRAKTVPLRVPANSEIVIEGWVSTECGPIGWDPRDPAAGPLGPGAAFEGPFGDHTGFYSLPDRYPLVEVTAVTHRRNAVFPAIVVGPPPQEDYPLGKATERIFGPLLRTLIPDLDDYHLPMFGCFHDCAFVRIRKEYPLQARRVMHAIWGAGQMAWTKFIVVVDADVDVHDEAAVLRAVFEHAHLGRDVERVNGPLDILDHAAPRLGAGGKLGIDATRKVAGEEVNGVAVGEVPRRAAGGSAEAERLRARLVGAAPNAATTSGAVRIRCVAVPEVGFGRFVVVGVEKREAGDGARAIEAMFAGAGDLPADFVVAVDAASVPDPADVDRVLFLLCANVDPSRDLHRSADGSRFGIDATAKLPGDARHAQPVRPWPEELQMA